MPVVIYNYKRLGDIRVPIITLAIKYGDRWYPVEAYMDSGATYSVFTAQVANRIGLDYRTGRRIFVQVGDGSFIPVYLHELDVQIGSYRFLTTLGFSDKLGNFFVLELYYDVDPSRKDVIAHGKRVVSMAILTGKERGRGEGIYELEAYGSGVEFRYLFFRLMDYDREKLENDLNPIATVVLASQERERAKQRNEMFNAKLYLIRKLYDRGYGRDEIRGLFGFIDWVLQLSEEEEKIVWEEIKERPLTK